MAELGWKELEQHPFRVERERAQVQAPPGGSQRGRQKNALSQEVTLRERGQRDAG